MKYKKAYGESYVDEGSEEIVLTLKPTFLWWLLGKKILISKEDLNSKAKQDYY